MKKLVLILGALLALNANADNEFKFTPNDAGGYIFFTYSTCVYVQSGERIPNNFYVYSTNSNGKKIIDGCYEYKSPFYVINWNSGGRTVIKADTTRPIN